MSVPEGLLRSGRAGRTESPAGLPLLPHFGLHWPRKPDVALEAKFLAEPPGVIDRPSIAALSIADARSFP